MLTASKEELTQRLTKRGDPDLIERRLFLKSKLEELPENRDYLFNISGLTVNEEVKALLIEKHEVPLK